MMRLPGRGRSLTISSAVSIQHMNVTDGRRTDTGLQQRPRLRIASRGKNTTKVETSEVFQPTFGGLETFRPSWSILLGARQHIPRRSNQVITQIVELWLLHLLKSEPALCSEDQRAILQRRRCAADVARPRKLSPFLQGPTSQIS